ncbi:MAG: glycosyltransferase [Candidatus Hodarchaeota archaeon]
MKIAYITTEMVGVSSGVLNQNRITLKFLQDHPEVEKFTVIQTPGTEFGIPPLKRQRFIDLVNILPRLPKNVLLYIKRSKSIADKIMDESKAIKSKIKKYKLTNSVIIDENVLPYEEMGYIYSACDIACFPFVNEPGGNCAMEALANGKPLVVYDSGYFPYYIKNNGFIVKPENPVELHEKIKILLEDEKLAIEMGEKSRELAQQ